MNNSGAQSQEINEKLAKLKQLVKDKAIIKGRIFTWQDYWKLKGQLLKTDEVTIQDIKNTFGEENQQTETKSDGRQTLV